jgi:dynein heavy chain
MGKFYVEEPPMKMETIYAESDKTTPIIFVLSPGSDPR